MTAFDNTFIQDIKVDKEHILDVAQNVAFNRKIIKYYYKLLSDLRYLQQRPYKNLMDSQNKQHLFSSSKYVRKIMYAVSKEVTGTQSVKHEKVTTLQEKIGSMYNCNNLWLVDIYEHAKIKDFIGTNLCKDKFCTNCKKVKQASRMSRFIPHIQEFNHYNMYHLTLTVPNVSGLELRSTINQMFKSFARLIEYFKGKKKITGVNFEKFSYQGAIRSLEVTYQGDSYHPHLHVLLCLNYEQGTKNIQNKFSYRKGKLDRFFSSDEILIQKIWYLLMNGKKVTLSNINDIAGIRKKMGEKIVDDIGYSCILDKFPEDGYFELFKYMTKAASGEDTDEIEDRSLIRYENFVTLYFSLKNVRQIQGYGCFFRIQDIDYDDQVLLYYDTFISNLSNESKPVKQSEKLGDLLVDDEYTLISRKRIYPYLRMINEKEKSAVVSFEKKRSSLVVSEQKE
jgi:plasmid rolling circle replication initiator protein Rep